MLVKRKQKDSEKSPHPECSTCDGIHLQHGDHLQDCRIVNLQNNVKSPMLIPHKNVNQKNIKCVHKITHSMIYTQKQSLNKKKRLGHGFQKVLGKWLSSRKTPLPVLSSPT